MKSFSQQIAEFGLTIRDLWVKQGRRNERVDKRLDAIEKRLTALEHQQEILGVTFGGVANDLRELRKAE